MEQWRGSRSSRRTLTHRRDLQRRRRIELQNYLEVTYLLLKRSSEFFENALETLASSEPLPLSLIEIGHKAISCFDETVRKLISPSAACPVKPINVAASARVGDAVRVSQRGRLFILCEADS